MFEFQFESLMAFLEMAPHGSYVWPVYLLGLGVLGGLTWANVVQHRRRLRSVRRHVERERTHES
ncbi:MAG TPA: heme exporter protein CcmD [Gammaproteobacteria bacterium]|nr:heme exporter protein CcmD [Gammaproteobacteria bacterium]